jgi:antitoxin component of RelBE/YafQ-DinJ toxin-antitoxin module
VPVRLQAETIEQVKRIADNDGMTVSAWIRRTVQRALRQRMAGDTEQPARRDETRLMVERLQRDVADLAAALDRPERR